MWFCTSYIRNNRLQPKNESNGFHLCFQRRTKLSPKTSMKIREERRWIGKSDRIISLDCVLEWALEGFIQVSNWNIPWYLPSDFIWRRISNSIPHYTASLQHRSIGFGTIWTLMAANLLVGRLPTTFVVLWFHRVILVRCLTCWSCASLSAFLLVSSSQLTRVLFFFYNNPASKA